MFPRNCRTYGTRKNFDIYLAIFTNLTIFGPMNYGTP